MAQVIHRLEGIVDGELWRRAWQLLADAHPALRTSFRWHGLAHPVQVVLATAKVPWEVVDWRYETALDQRLEDFLREDRQRGFDLSGPPPLMRFLVVRYGEISWRLIWSFHQSIFDGWSLPLLVEDFLAALAALQRGSAVPSLHRPAYRQHIGWLRSRGDRAAEMQYWRGLLADWEGTPPLPFDRPATSFAAQDESVEGDVGELQSRLGVDCWQRLQQHARTAGVTVHTVVQGAWAQLLGRYGGAREAVFGGVVSGRPPDLPGVEEIIGLFINTLPVRIRWRGAEAAGPWLQSVQRSQVAQRAYEATSLAEIQRWTEVPAQELFGTMVVFQNYPLEQSTEQAPENLVLEVEAPRERSHLPLVLAVTPGDELVLELSYRRDRFDHTTARRLLGHFESLLRCLPAEPRRRLDEAPMLAPAQRHQVVTEWGQGSPSAASLGDEASVLVAWRRSAELDPEAPALIHRDEVWNYRRLAAAVRGATARLRILGARPAATVAVCGHRSAELVTALLAVLETGAVLLPLDPDFPPGRLAAMVEDARPVLLVLGTGVDGEDLSTAAGPSAKVWRGPLSPPTDQGLTPLPPPPTPPPASLAYRLYTSGSSGRPKAVLVEHRQLAHTVLGCRRRGLVRREDRLLHLASFSFDIALLELLLPLVCGAAVEVLPAEAVRDPRRLTAAVERSTVVHAVPTLWRTLLAAAAENGSAGWGGAVRKILVGGERVPGGLVEDLQRIFPAATVDVLYGPTEAAILATAQSLPRGNEERPVEGEMGGRLGHPLPGVRVRLQDAMGRPAAPAAMGEILLGGGGVARGYGGSPGLTAAAFVPDPWGPGEEETGRRLYRTGDLGRWMPDGGLEFLGRRDGQLKVRGHRIEVSAVEALLEEAPGVAAAAVVGRPGSDGGLRLVAFVVGAGEPLPDPRELRRRLEHRLPLAVVPESVEILPQLPRTPTGKVDRRALLQRPGGAAAVAASFDAPRGPVEEALAELWQEVLRVERVGRDDDFFELGGDSILSIQIASRAHRYGLEVRPRQLFEHRSVAQLAALVECSPLPSAAAEAAEAPGPLPLTPIQAWFFEQRPSRPDHFNQSLLLTLPPDLPPAPLEPALAALVAHHGALRLRFVAPAAGAGAGPGAGGGWSQEVMPPAAVPVRLPRLDLSRLGAPEEELERVCDRLQRSLDLGRGRLVRGLYFRLAPLPPSGVEPGRGARLFLAVHHLAVDGVSWRILLEDLEIAYRALARGEEAQLVPAGTSWASWSRALAAMADSAEIRAQAQGWRDPRWSRSRPLPRDPERWEESGEEVAAGALSAADTATLLRELPRAFGAGLEDALLAALGRAVQRWTGSSRILLQMESHGRQEELLPGSRRPRVDLSRTVGWFTAVYPLLFDLGQAEGPAAALVAAKETLRRVPGDGLAYGVARHLAADPALSAELARLPEPEIGFNYLGRLDLALARESPFELAPESAGRDSDPEAPGGHLFELSAQVHQDRLEVEWGFRPRHHRRATVEALLGEALAELSALADHCRSSRAGAYTPSDFPLAGLSSAALETVLSGIGTERRGAVRERRLEDLYPLAPAQLGMLFHSLLAPEAELYVEQLGATLRGPVDLDRLHRACRDVVQRHPVLRTSLVWHGLERPLQLVWRQVEIPWTVEDLRSLPAAEQRRHLDDVLRQDRRRGFDLQAPPLMAFRLFRLADDAVRIVWGHHHLLLDGWCQELIFQQLFERYDQLGRGLAPPPTRERPYRDFIAWLEAQDLESAERYWRRRLAGFTQPTPLTFDRPPAVEAGAPEEAASLQRSVELSEAVTEELLASCRRRGLTLAALAHGAWALLLARYGGLREATVGSVVAGRPAELPGVEEMVGLFINTLPLRLPVPPKQPVVSWLQLVQERHGELRQYEYTPLLEVQRWSEVPGGTALFDSILVVQNLYSDDPPTGEDLGFEITDLANAERTDFPITAVVEQLRRLELRLEYEAQRFEAVDIQRMLVHWSSLLSALAAADDEPLAALPLLSPAERHQLQIEWGRGAQEEAASLEGETAAVLDLFELFARSARRAPQAPALLCGDRSWSYGALAHQARRLAGELRRRGVGGESRVALVTGRCPEMILGILGVLAAGAAYVPLDPADPPPRLRSLLADSGATLVLARAGAGLTLEPLPDGSERAQTPPVLEIELGAPGAAAPRETALGDREDGAEAQPWRAAAPTAAACCLFTSGSTGRPKAVVTAHGPLLRFAREMARQLELTARDRVVQFAAPTFDVVLEELLPAWSVGAAVIQPAASGAVGLAELEALLSTHRGTVLELPAAYWQLWVEALAAAARRPPESLRLLLLGAETPDPAQLRRWAGWGVPVVHVFGLTETAVTSCCHRAEARELLSEGQPSEGLLPTELLPVGRPLPGTRLAVADPSLELLPVGAPGELLIAGEGLARGYRGRPAATARRFLPDPHSTVPGARLYRSGDVARWRSDGRLEFLGRLDHQVKVRGLRIELGEVEARLLEVPGVRQVAVVVEGNSPADRRLVAHGVFGEEVPEDAPLLAQLRRRLPAALVPAQVVRWSALPTTSHGKVDRRALTRASGNVTGPASRPPRTSLERRIAKVWEEVLGLEAVGAEESFFDLGGDSLRLIRLASRLGAVLGREVPLVQVFAHPTVAGLADHLGGEEDPDRVQALARRRAETRTAARRRIRRRRVVPPNPGADGS